MLSSFIVSIVALIFLLIFVLYRRKIINKVITENSAMQTEELARKLEMTADVVISRLENKIDELESIIEMADVKICELQKRLQTVDAVATTSQQHKSSNLENLIPSEKHEKDSKLLLTPRANDTDNTKATVLPEQEDNRKLILAMAEQGYSIVEIARATGKGKGEIMLVLQLHKS